MVLASAAKVLFFGFILTSSSFPPLILRFYLLFRKAVNMLVPCERMRGSLTQFVFVCFRELPPISQETAAWRMLSWLRSSSTQK